MDPRDIAIFALEASRSFGEEVSSGLRLPLALHEERSFADGEHKVRPLESVRGRDVYVVQSLHDGPEESVNDKLCRLLFFIGALRDAGAQLVTAVVPYLCYARKERKTKTRDPVTTRYVAGLFEAVGTDRVVTMDVHSLAAWQNAFRIATEHLEARPLFVRHLLPRIAHEEVVVVSPDAGGAKRATALRDHLERALEREVGTAFMEKKRSKGEVTGEVFVGEVEGRVALIVDDLVNSGTTLARAARAVRQRGARSIHAAVTHGLFLETANAVLEDPALDSFIVTDTVPPFRLRPELVEERLVTLRASALFAQAIRAMHEGATVVDLNEPVE